jgi:outer membrane immunogenic protein
MRRLFVALGLIAATSGAFAQEFELPTLRGSDRFVPNAPVIYSRWDGFYAGAQVGYGFTSMDFATTTRSLIAHELRELALENEVHPSNWQVLGRANTHSTIAGGFFGYNIGWESLIAGFELNYNHSNFSADAPLSPITRVTAAGGNVYLLTITGAASMTITDFATLRARVGYEVYNFLPYAMIGVAVGRANLSRTATAFGQENPNPVCPGAGPPPCTPFSFTEAESRSGAFIYGWSLGGGFDVYVMPGVFLRAEYEYVAFSPIWEIKANIQTVRGAIGFKFP